MRWLYKWFILYVNCPHLPRRFTSDHTVTGKGFKLEYHTVQEGGTYHLGKCGGYFTTPHGLLTSPSYPANYPDSANCTYIVSLPQDSYIKLTLLQVDVHCLSPESDYMEMRDGDSEDAPLMIRFCHKGEHIPAHLTTSQNFFWMRCVQVMCINTMKWNVVYFFN